jgi:ribosomal protein S18 acetylase RimI-like enzyme
MKIRRGKISDLAELIKLKDALTEFHTELDPIYNGPSKVRAVTKESLEKCLNDDWGFVFVAEEDGKLIGYISGYVAEDEYVKPQLTGKIINIIVLGEHRNKGLGRLLFDRAESHLESRGVNYLTIKVHIDNTQALAAYRSFGFKDFNITLNKKL